MRHLLGHQQLVADRAIIRPAPHGEIVTGDHHRPPLDLRPAHQEIRGREIHQFAGLVIAPGAGQRADFDKGIRVDQLRDPFAYRQLAVVSVTLQLLLAAHLFSQAFAGIQLVDLFLPGQSVLLGADDDAQPTAALFERDAGALDGGGVVVGFTANACGKLLWIQHHDVALLQQ